MPLTDKQVRNARYRPDGTGNREISAVWMIRSVQGVISQ